MPRLDLEALQRAMRQQNMLFKHQLANLVGISYDRLAALFGNPDEEVDEETVTRLYKGLNCERSDIVAAE